MTTQEENEILYLVQEEIKKARGYADFFDWQLDRDIEEWGVLSSLAESLKLDGRTLFSNLKRRGRPNDPPDCEARDNKGRRIAIEVTELVDGKTIQNYKAGHVYEWADWDKELFLSSLESLLYRKDSSYPKLKDPPYEGGYFVVIFTDEPLLNHSTVESYLAGYKFKKPKYLTKAFLLLSYDPSVKKCPYYELYFNS